MINRKPNINTKKWIVNYAGEFLGDIIRGFNLDLFSNKGKVKTGKKIYPHTTGLSPAYAFCKARIDNGETGATGPTGETTKLWAVVDDGVKHSYENEEFLTGPTGGISEDEEITEKSDILSVADETEEPIETLPVSISGEEKEFTLGRFATATKMAQPISISGPLNQITFQVRKIGSPTDLIVSIQEDDDDKPEGTPIISKSIDKMLIGTFLQEFVIKDEEMKFDAGKKYWLVIEKAGAEDASHYYIINTIIGSQDEESPYEYGNLKRWQGSAWVEQRETFLKTTDLVVRRGGESDLWGTTWTPAEVNNSEFGITRVTGNASASPAYVYSIDYISIKVYYTYQGDDYETPFRYPASNTAITIGGTPMDPWANPTNAYTSNGSYATASIGDPEYHCWHNFGFTIPNDATINGIEVEMKAKTSIDNLIISGGLTKDKNDLVGSTYNFGLRPFSALKTSISVSFPSASERLYLTTTKDVLFLGSETDKWYSLWRGILRKDDLNEDYPVILKSLSAGGVLLLANDNKVHTLIATANTPSEADENRLIFDADYFINWVGITSSAVFIGLQNKKSELLPSRVVYYEPYAERTRIFNIEEGATMGFIKDENCHLIDKAGQIRYFTGASFENYQYLPCYFREEKVNKLPHRNGIIAKGDTIKILWEGQYPDPAGIWVLEDRNLYHSNSFVFDKEVLNSLGAMEVDKFGALYEEEQVFAGASLIDGSEDEVKGIYSDIKTDVSEENYAHFTTSKFITSEINNIWQDIAIKYDPEGKEGKFVIKQKIEPNRVSPIEKFNGEWTSDDTFTCDDASFVEAVDNDKIKAGDEIIIRKGQGAGLLAHIIEISGTAIKSVIIDEGLEEISAGKFTFSVEAWEKINFNFKNNKFSEKASLKDKRLEQAQFKVDMREYTLEEMQISSVVDHILDKK